MSEAKTKEADRKASSDYLDLEPKIRNVMYMAGIAAFLAHDALDALGQKDGPYELIRLTPEDHERLLFAVQKVSDMTVELHKTYSDILANVWEPANV
jgi:hypothetical protein